MKILISLAVALDRKDVVGDVDEYVHTFIVTLNGIQVYSKFSGSLDLLTPT